MELLRTSSLPVQCNRLLTHEARLSSCVAALQPERLSGLICYVHALMPAGCANRLCGGWAAVQPDGVYVMGD
jgi:hypothetical protein